MLIEPILLYGSETWTLASRQQQPLDGTYTNLLPRAQNIHFSEHATRSREHLRKSSTTLPEACQAATSIRRSLPESYEWDCPDPLTVAAKWPYPLQTIDLSRRDYQGLRDRKVRSRERYSGPWSLEHSCCVRPDLKRWTMMRMMMMMMMAHCRRYQLFCIMLWLSEGCSFCNSVW